MPPFRIIEHLDDEQDPFDRQKRISWWHQQALTDARVLVVGAGAVGNEVLKNLALLGVGYILIADFDEVSTSNISRTVLFRADDVGKKKSEVAARRTKDLCTNTSSSVDWFHGDVVWDLGSGVFRQFDVVLACLDNVETRLWLNRQCRMVGVPWIDAGIYELAVRVNTYLPDHDVCYECTLSSEQRSSARARYSCDDFKRRYVQQGRLPTVQIAAALVGAIQVQEAVKLLCKQTVAAGSRIYYQGLNHDFDVIALPSSKTCSAHVRIPTSTSLSFTSDVTLRQLLRYVSTETAVGPGARIVLVDRVFVVNALCRVCEAAVMVRRPAFRVFADQVVCGACQPGGFPLASTLDGATRSTQVIAEDRTSEDVLDLTVREIGLPLLHDITIRDHAGRDHFFELSGDALALMPGRPISRSRGDGG